MDTICAECEHYRLDGLDLHLCVADWGRTVSLVTGCLEPSFRDCYEMNDGGCRLYKRKIRRSLWRRLFRNNGD